MTPIDRIKDLLNVWAHYYRPLPDRGFPRTCSFVTERVQTSRSTEAMVDEIPEEVKSLNTVIESVLEPIQKRVLSTEYLNRDPQKTKAPSIGMNRTDYCKELSIIYRSLAWQLYGHQHGQNSN